MREPRLQQKWIAYFFFSFVINYHATLSFLTDLMGLNRLLFSRSSRIAFHVDRRSQQFTRVSKLEFWKRIANELTITARSTLFSPPAQLIVINVTVRTHTCELLAREISVHEGISGRACLKRRPWFFWPGRSKRSSPQLTTS